MDVQRVLNHRFEDRQISYDERDVMLYALGVNLARDPCDAADLKYVYEDGLVALPGFAMVLGYPGPWLQDPAMKVDWVRMLHAEQSLVLHRPIPTSGTVNVAFRVLGIADKGADKGCLLYYEKSLTDAHDGPPLAQIVTGIFCRGDGGTGDHGAVPSPLQQVPAGKPDAVITTQIDPRAALIYRLTGDRNPIHADPAVAKKVGYPRPILHGLSTMGIASYQLLEHLADGDPARFSGVSCRFNRPVFPGDAVRTEIWKTAEGAQFRMVAETREDVILDRGAVILKS